MKYVKAMLTVWFLVLATGLMSCNESPEIKAEEADKATVKLSNPDDELDKAKTISAEEYARFKEETEMTIAANEVRIVSLRTKMLVSKADLQTQYEKDLNRIKAQNEKLKKDIGDFTYVTNKNWEAFKSGIENDVDQIGKSISEISEIVDKKQ